MANKDAAFGLKAIGKVGQNRDNQGLSEYSIAASSAAIYQWDPVKTAGGYLLVAGAGGDIARGGGAADGVRVTTAVHGAGADRGLAGVAGGGCLQRRGGDFHFRHVDAGLP